MQILLARKIKNRLLRVFTYFDFVPVGDNLLKFFNFQ